MKYAGPSSLELKATELPASCCCCLSRVLATVCEVSCRADCSAAHHNQQRTPTPAARAYFRLRALKSSNDCASIQGSDRTLPPASRYLHARAAGVSARAVTHSVQRTLSDEADAPCARTLCAAVLLPCAPLPGCCKNAGGCCSGGHDPLPLDVCNACQGQNVLAPAAESRCLPAILAVRLLECFEMNCIV
jgi:hypothetical protein